MVSASSSVADPSVSSPLHSVLSSALSSRSVPSTQYFPADLLLLTCVSPVTFRLTLARAAVVSVTAVFLLSAPNSLRVSPPPSLFLPPVPTPPHPPSLGILRPPAPPPALPPPALAADIARKDKDFGNQTSGGEARWLVAGEQAPHRGGGRHQPDPILSPALTVAPSALLDSVAEFTRSGGQDRRGSGQVPGVATEPLNRLTDPYARQTTYI